MAVLGIYLDDCIFFGKDKAKIDGLKMYFELTVKDISSEGYEDVFAYFGVEVKNISEQVR